jgi:hypothetical protein
MASSYDRLKAGNHPATLGLDGATITYSGGTFTVPDTVKHIVLCTTGNVVCTPVNAGASITLTSWPAGAFLPWHCASITEIGTTATLATVIG